MEVDPADRVVPGGRGTAVEVGCGQVIDIVNIFGSQVVDFWAFGKENAAEYLSMPHCRSVLEKLHFTRGDALYSNRRRKILEIVEDTSPGIHDSLLAACDAERYRLLGVHGYHANCADNLREALAPYGIAPDSVPAPWNIFENVVVERGLLEIRPPLSRPGDRVRLRALDDLVVVMSACPMDVVPTNGADRTPKDVAFRVL